MRTHRHRRWLVFIQVSAMDYGIMNINESIQDRGCLNTCKKTTILHKYNGHSHARSGADPSNAHARLLYTCISIITLYTKLWHHHML